MNGEARFPMGDLTPFVRGGAPTGDLKLIQTARREAHMYDCRH
jgi:hypothetical protein